jgi:hypothetical protein
MVLSAVHSQPMYFAAWLILGIGMGAGLYDPAFATLGRLYGDAARSAITTLTLFGGFASTVCWPLSALLVTHLGWRGTCLAYAAFHIAVMLPIFLAALPREEERRTSGGIGSRTSLGDALSPRIEPPWSLTALLAIAITLSSMISTLLSVHLLDVLQSRGVGLATAVALGALVGPSQVGARTIEFFLARYHHPIWTKVVSTLLVAIGVGALWAAFPVLGLPLMLYGAGIGLESIARGTLPLVLFKAPRYAAVMGRLAMPSLIAQAASPSIGAALIAAYGANGALATLSGVAAVNFCLTVIMFAGLKRCGILAAQRAAAA